MVPFEEALKKAKKYKKRIDRFTEYKTAYVFANERDINSIGGEGVCIIMKRTGEALNFIGFRSIADVEEDYIPIRSERIKENKRYAGSN